MRQPVRRLSRAELEEIPQAAAYFVYGAYKQEHPQATEEEAQAFARRNWRQGVDRAIDFLAIRAAIDEQEVQRN